MRKYTIAGILAVLLFLGLFALPAFAEESVVTYYGIKEGFTFVPGSEYTETDLFDGFKGVMPGDRLTETIVIRNRARDCDYIRLYLRAEVHDETENPLSPGVAAEGETVESMRNFLSQLSMQVWQGTRLIFEGSPDIADGLAQYVSLGKFQRGETAELTVYLDVPQELGNEFQYRTGEVDWVFAVEAFDYPQPPPVVDQHLTVHKVWSKDDPDTRPEEITVQLLKNGGLYDEVELNGENQWTYTWDKLALWQDWSVVEANIPEGYEAVYDVRGSLTIITNRWTADEKEPLPEEKPEETEPSDEEPSVPELPPENPEQPEDPVCLTVRKIWSGDEKTLEKRPDTIGVTLYNGDTAVETVWLSQGNDWMYTWTELDPAGDWSVMENEIPKGYTPSYRAERTESGKLVTITNTSSLLQTGQLNWPVPILLLVGLLLIAAGIILMKKKKKKEKNRA